MSEFPDNGRIVKNIVNNVHNIIKKTYNVLNFVNNDQQ